MNILVCMKRVPDTATKIKVAADGKNIDEGGVQFIVNPYDEFAIEEGHESIGVEGPALLTTNKGLNEPRCASLKGIMAAKKKPIEEKKVEFAEEGTLVAAMEYPPERKGGRIVGAGVDAVPELVRL